MRRTPTLRAALPLLLLLLLHCGAAAADEEEPSYTYRTPNYAVETGLSPRFAEIVGRHMEQILKEYSKRFADYGEVEDRFDVAVFSTEEQYWEHVPPQVKGSTGVFVSREKLLAAHAENRTPEEVLRTLYHEGFHQFMYEVVSKDCPVWLNEGLAEYFSEATWTGGSFRLGQVPDLRLHVVQEAIRKGTYVGFRELFGMDSEAWLQNVRFDSHRASLIYSQSWSIVQFLVHAGDGRYASGLDAMLKAIAEGKDGEEALEEAFGPEVSLAAFEREWARYMLSVKPSAKFRCRQNMESLMLLARHLYEDIREFQDVEKLRRKALFNRRMGWEIVRPTGEKVSSRDRDEAAGLFRCPFDREAHAVSYIVVRDPVTGLPVLVCNEHPGVILKAYYARRSGGQMHVAVEEEVRELARPDLKQAIMMQVH